MLGLGVKSGYANVTAQERVNCFIENVKDAEKASTVCYGTPGLTLFSDYLGDTPVRGIYSFGDYLYVVHRSNFWRIDNGGTFVQLGNIASTTSRCSLSCNSTQILIVDGTDEGYIYNIAPNADVSISNASPCVVTDTNHGLPDGAAIQFSTTGSLPTGLSTGTTYYVTYVNANSYKLSATRGGSDINTSGAGSGVHARYTYLSAITDGDFVGGVSSAFLNGYFIINRPNSQTYYISSLYDGLSWSSLEFASAESSPDNILRVFVDHSQLLLLGKFTTENHADVGTLDFPFARTGIAIDWGIVGAWSLARLDNSVAFLARKRMGEVQVVMYTGGTPQRISNHDIERLLNSFSNLDDSTAWSYTFNGHPMYVLNAGGYTFMYDLSSGCWSYLKGFGIDRHRAQMSESFQNKTIVTDYENGNLYWLDGDAYDDNGAPLIMTISGKHIFNGINRLTINEINIDMEMGVGLVSGQGVNPQIGLSVSKDSGNSWGNQRFASIGKIGEYKNLVRFGQLGQARDFVLKLEISDPVKRQISGVYADIEADND